MFFYNHLYRNSIVQEIIQESGEKKSQLPINFLCDTQLHNKAGSVNCKLFDLISYHCFNFRQSQHSGLVLIQKY